jgi:hypothetical protein
VIDWLINSIDFAVFATTFQYSCLRLGTQQYKEHCTGTTRVRYVWHLRNASRNFHIMVILSSLQYSEDLHITSVTIFSGTDTSQIFTKITNTQALLANAINQSELTYLHLTWYDIHLVTFMQSSLKNNVVLSSVLRNILFV